MSSRVYTTYELSLITGFSLRQLDYWAKQGLLVPSIQQAHGPGTRKLYSVEDLIQLQFIRRLKQHGWSTQNLRKAMNTLRNVTNDPNPLKHAILVHGKNVLIAVCKTREGERVAIDALSLGGQQVMGVVLEMLLEEAQQIANDIDDSMMKEEVIG